MDSSEEDIYFQKLQEMIEDEDKIVTVSSLARTLNIPVQDSVKILNKYLEDNRKLKPDCLAATYVLVGTRKNEKCVVCLVKEIDVKSKRDDFKEITSETLYSLQKSKDVDLNIVDLADWSNSKNSTEEPKPLMGTVITSNCTKRILKSKNLPPPTVPTIKGKSSFFEPKDEPKSTDTSSEENKNHAGPKVNLKSGTITNMFNKKMDNKKETEQKKPIPKQKSGKGTLSSFFSKTSNLSSNEHSKEEEVKNVSNLKASDLKNLSIKDISNTTSKTPPKNSIEEMDIGSDTEMKEENEKPTIKENSRKNNNSSKIKKDSNKSSKRAREKSNDKSNKRKRIIQNNDSDSDDIFGNDENEEDLFEKSDDEPKNPSPIPVKPLAPKNKKRVAVDRSYMDEEGFMVTKKEYVYESASEDESDKNPVVPEIKEEKQPQKTSEKKSSASSENNTSPQKGGKGKKAKKNLTQNQPTLMNFFKKK